MNYSVTFQGLTLSTFITQRKKFEKISALSRNLTHSRRIFHSRAFQTKIQHRTFSKKIEPSWSSDFRECHNDKIKTCAKHTRFEQLIRHTHTTLQAACKGPTILTIQYIGRVNQTPVRRSNTSENSPSTFTLSLPYQHRLVDPFNKSNIEHFQKKLSPHGRVTSENVTTIK